MMLVSLIRMISSLTEVPTLMLLESCECRTHQAEAAGEQLPGHRSGHDDHGASAALVDGGRHSDAAGEQGAEAADAGVAKLHAHTGHRVVFNRQHMPRAIEPCPDPELVRGITKQGAELADEMERGHRCRSRHLFDRPRPV